MKISDKWINSPKQLLIVLQTIVDPRIKSTSKEALESYNSHEFVQKIMEYRNTVKLANTFIKPCSTRYFNYGDYSVMFTSFSSFMTNSTRFSSSGPNAQNFPANPKIRNLVQVKPPYCIITGDMSNIEPRILAQVTGDPALRTLCNGDKPFYIALANTVMGQDIKKGSKEYSIIKKVVLGIMYGQGEYSLSFQLGISVPECKYYITKIYDMFPTILEWKKDLISILWDYGYSCALDGTKRFFHGIYSDSREESSAVREAINHQIQGTAAACNRLSLLYFTRTMKNTDLFYKLFSTVHDEANVLCLQDEAEAITEIMSRTFIEAHKFYLPDINIEMDIKHSQKWGDNK